MVGQSCCPSCLSGQPEIGHPRKAGGKGIAKEEKWGVVGWRQWQYGLWMSGLHSHFSLLIGCWLHVVIFRDAERLHHLHRQASPLATWKRLFSSLCSVLFLTLALVSYMNSMPVWKLRWKMTLFCSWDHHPFRTQLMSESGEGGSTNEHICVCDIWVSMRNKGCIDWFHKERHKMKWAFNTAV